MKDDATFVADLLHSDVAVQRVGAWLAGQGYTVRVPPVCVRPDVTQRNAYRDQGDLFLEVAVEVKRRRELHFTGLHDFPYEEVIVDVAATYDHKRPKPFCYLILNAAMTGALVVEKRTRRFWRKETRFDRHAQQQQSFYLCPLSHCLFVKLGEA